MYKKGCFASPLSFNVEDEACAKCEISKACQQQIQKDQASSLNSIERKLVRLNRSDQAKRSVFSELDVRFGNKQRRGTQLTKDERSISEVIGQKRPITEVVELFGNCEKYKWFSAVCSFIQEAKVFSRRDVSEFLNCQMGYSVATASKLSTRAVKILNDKNIIEKDGNLYCLT